MDIQFNDQLYFLFIMVTILVTNNFLFFKLVSKLVTIVTKSLWSLKLVVNEIIFCSNNFAYFLELLRTLCNVYNNYSTLVLWLGLSNNFNFYL